MSGGRLFVSWDCHRAVWGMSQGLRWVTSGLYWGCLGVVLVLYSYSYEVGFVLSWGCLGVVLGLF